MKSFYVILFLFVGTVVSFGQTTSFEKLDQYLQILDEEQVYMGSVALMKGGEIIYTNEIGYADVEQKKEINSDTKIRIGSISKTFTAVMVLKAVEEGKLSLDTKLSAFFPEIENAEEITISQILLHRSGIHNFTNDEAYMTYNTETKSRDEMMAIIQEAGVDFAPNEKTSYSNSGFLILSYILEDIYNQSYGEILEDKIVTPLGLKRTELGKKIEDSDNEAYSYIVFKNFEKSTETDSSIPLGAGAITSTPTDLVIFAHALFNGKLLSDSSLETMKTFDGDMAMGLFKIPFGDSVSLGHTGGIDEFRSVFSYFEEEDIAFAQISNGNNYDTNDLSVAILSAAFGEEFDLPEFSDFEPEFSDVESYVGYYKTNEIPIDIEITNEGTTIIAQATGQPAFPLNPVQKHVFDYQAVGAVFTFIPEENKLILEQMGQSFTFTKE